MKNPELAYPETELAYKGKTYTIKCTFGTLVRFQKETGRNPFDGSVWAKVGPLELATLAWAALNIPGTTVEEVADGMNMKDFEKLGNLLGSLFQQGNEEAPEETQNPEASEKKD